MTPLKSTLFRMERKLLKSTLFRKLVSYSVVRYLFTSRMLPEKLVVYFLSLGLRVEGRTMVNKRRLANLYDICSHPSLPEGSFVECGVARGGCVAIMSYVSDGRRPVWGFDSFEVMPELTKEDEGDGQKWVGFDCSGSDGLYEAQRTLERFYVYGDWVKLVPGWFEDTVPKYGSQLEPIAILRLDNDWYKSTKYCLENLYQMVAPGGVVLIDDYHTFQGCKKAVDEFRQSQGITSRLITSDTKSEVYWYK